MREDIARHRGRVQWSVPGRISLEAGGCENGFPHQHLERYKSRLDTSGL